MFRTLAAGAAVTLALSGCIPKAAQEDATETVRLSDLVAVEGPAPTGRFYVNAGENSLDADLYELRFSPRGHDRLTTKGRVSTLDGCNDRVVVSAAQKEVGLTDHIQELRGGKLVPIKGLGLERGSGPHVAADCRILYLRVIEENGELIDEIVLFDPATGATSSVIKGDTVAAATWGPNGEILVLKREPAGPVLEVIRPDGSLATINPEQPDVGNLHWGKGGWIVMGIAEPRQPPTASLFLNPSTGERSRLDGWLPLAWSPDGRQLLVAEAKNGTTLAVVELTDLSKPRNVGVSEVGTVWDAVWLPA